jgi:DNA-binding MarR family transcriptional regulator
MILSNGFKLSRDISIIFRHGKAYIDSEMAAYAIGSGQYGFLYFLYAHDGATQDEISKALDMDKATTARAIQKLELNGFVKRKRNESDHRVNNVFLTEKSKQLKSDLFGIARRWDAILLENFSEAEKETLQHLMLKLSQNAKSFKDCCNHHKEDPICHTTND